MWLLANASAMRRSDRVRDSTGGFGALWWGFGAAACASSLVVLTLYGRYVVAALVALSLPLSVIATMREVRRRNW